MTTNIMPGFTPQKTDGVTPAKKDTRLRCQFRFWVNANDPDDYSLGELLASLKRDRKFTSTIKAGVKLITDLRSGRVDSLVAMFPWIVEAFKPTPGDEYERLLREFAEFKAETRQQLQPLSLPFTPPAIAADPPPQARTAHNPAIATPESVASPGIVAPDAPRAALSNATPVPRVPGPKPLAGAARPLPGPIIDDDDDGATLVLKPIQDGQSGRNFVTSMNALVSP